MHLFHLFIVLATFNSAKGFAHESDAYSHDSSIYRTHADWMREVPGNRRVKDLSLPGTHDTMSLYWGDIVQTQSMTLETQLLAGIRVLDIRCRPIDDKFAIYHNEMDLFANFDDVLLTVTQFLQNHSDETVLMRVKEESDTSSGETFINILKGYMEDPNYRSYFWKSTDTNVTLDEVRGKIVVLCDFPGVNDFGLNYSQFNIQDNYVVVSNWNLYDKWTDVKNQLVNASNSTEADRSFYMNYLSASRGAFPYFIASGHSSNATSAPRLTTGLTTPGWNSSYPDFPRVDCFIGICTIAFEGTNILARNYIVSQKPAFVGIIMADFPGLGLIETIISLNGGLLCEADACFSDIGG